MRRQSRLVHQLQSPRHHLHVRHDHPTSRPGQEEARLARTRGLSDLFRRVGRVDARSWSSGAPRGAKPPTVPLRRRRAGGSGAGLLPEPVALLRPHPPRSSPIRPGYLATGSTVRNAAVGCAECRRLIVGACSLSIFALSTRSSFGSDFTPFVLVRSRGSSSSRRPLPLDLRFALSPSYCWSLRFLQIMKRMYNYLRSLDLFLSSACFPRLDISSTSACLSSLLTHMAYCPPASSRLH